MGLFTKKKRPVPGKVNVRQLIQHEAEIGARLFGYLPPNRRREFFCLDEKTWIWHEEWQDHTGVHRVTTRYEIHGDTILKLQDEKPAELVRGQELNNLYAAVRSYYYAVANEVYSRPVSSVEV